MTSNASQFQVFKNRFFAYSNLDLYFFGFPLVPITVFVDLLEDTL